MKTNFFQEFDKSFGKNETPQETLESVLLQASEQIHERFFNKGLDSIVTASQGSSSTFRNVNLNLVSLIGNNYSYQLIQARQPIDNETPIYASAFLNPATEEMKFDEVSKFQNWIIKDVIGNVRMRIVTEHLITMGENIREWRSEGEGASKQEKIMKAQLERTVNRAGALRLKNNSEINYGGIRVEGDDFFFYTRKGLDEIFNFKADQNVVKELKQKTEAELIKSEHIARIPISQIEKILF